MSEIDLNTEAKQIAAAKAYIDALVSHDASTVPFAPGCIRIEFGHQDGILGRTPAPQPQWRPAVPRHPVGDDAGVHG